MTICDEISRVGELTVSGIRQYRDAAVAVADEDHAITDMTCNTAATFERHEQ